MAAIDLSEKTVIRFEKNVANELVFLIKDTVTAKEYMLSIQSGALTFTNIADDSDIVTFSPDP